MDKNELYSRIKDRYTLNLYREFDTKLRLLPPCSALAHRKASKRTGLVLRISMIKDGKYPNETFKEFKERDFGKFDKTLNHILDIMEHFKIGV